MLRFYIYKIIADNVYDKLGIPEDAYLTFDKNSVEEYKKKYLNGDYNYIHDLVDNELAQYDTSDNHPDDIEDIRETAIDEVIQMIENNVVKYEQYQHEVTINTYLDIINLIKNSDIESIKSIETEYQPSDPEVGIYGEERAVVIELTNGSYISFNVEIED